MAVEIERKYLVSNDYKQDVSNYYRIVQGYLSSHPERSVRIRIIDDNAFITIKGKGNESGTTRFEWEKEIDIEEGENLLELCEPGVIEKTRNIVNYKDHIFEIDEFYGENAGLILCEVELMSEDEHIVFPHWIVKEVTGDPRYYNTSLIKSPFLSWK